MTALRITGATLADGTLIELAMSDGVIVDEVGAGEVLDAAGLTVASGFVDLQVNGGFGLDVTSDPSSMWEIGRRLPRFGVTAFLPTVISSSAGAVRAALDAVASGPPAGWRGAHPLGVHAEGPMLSPAKRGTHPIEALRLPGPAVLAEWGPLGDLRMVTLAPELAGAEQMVAALVDAGVVVALGHSDCDYATALLAMDWGATHGTHLFNAMSGVDHRRPGLATAILARHNITTGLIVDGEHVHPGAVEMAWAAKGQDGIVLVTDCMAAMGVGDGGYDLGGVEVVVRGRRATNHGGALAGSVLTMDQAVRNLVAYTGCPLSQALSAASTTPAGVIGDVERGGLEPGQRGDVVLLDGSMRVRATVVGGVVVHDERDHA